MSLTILRMLAAGVCAGGLAWGGGRLVRRRGRLPRWASGPWLAIGLAGLGALLFAALALLRYYSLTQRLPDLAAYDQAIWSTWHGQALHTTVWNFPTSVFGFQVSPLLFAFAPFTLFVPDGSYLAAIQAIALALGAIPIALWAYKRTGSAWAPAVLVLVYLFDPIVTRSRDLPFHQITLAPLFVGAAFYCQLNRRWPWFWLWFALALLTKDELVFSAFGLGLYALAAQRERRHGAAMLVVSAAWAYVCFGVIIPAFTGGAHQVYFASDYAFLGATTPAGLIEAAFLHPVLVLQHMFGPAQDQYLLFLAGCTGLLCLLGWRVVWLALPTLAYLLTGAAIRLDPTYYYGSALLPFLFFGLVEGLVWLRSRIPTRVALGYCLGVGAAGYYLLGTGPGTPGYRLLTPAEHTSDVLAAVASIPSDVSLSATTNIMPLAARRQDLKLFPEEFWPTDVVLADLKTWDGWHGYPASFNDYDQALRRLLTSPQYRSTYLGDGLVMARRGGQQPPPPSSPKDEMLGGQLQLLGVDMPATAHPGGQLEVSLYWRAAAPIRQPDTVTLQLVAADGQKAAQRDSWPWEGYFPTVEWTPGEQVIDPHWLSLPTTVQPGTYELLAGMYALEGGQPRPLLTAAGASIVDLGRVDVS